MQDDIFSCMHLKNRYLEVAVRSKNQGGDRIEQVPAGFIPRRNKQKQDVIKNFVTFIPENE